MNNCLFCKKETPNPKFCGRSCSATFSNKNRGERSEETKKKISASVKSWMTELKESDPEKFLEYRRNQSVATKNRYGSPEEREKKRNEELMKKDFNSLSFEYRRTRVILEQNGKCNGCGISEWRGKKLSLEIDHKNGDNLDHSRENLEAICPNCHSITPTFRARNKRRKIEVSDEMLLTALKKSPSIRQALIEVGLSAKGGNYIRAQKLLDTLDKREAVVTLVLQD